MFVGMGPSRDCVETFEGCNNLVGSQSSSLRTCDNNTSAEMARIDRPDEWAPGYLSEFTKSGKVVALQNINTGERVLKFVYDDIDYNNNPPAGYQVM